MITMPARSYVARALAHQDDVPALEVRGAGRAGPGAAAGAAHGADFHAGQQHGLVAGYAALEVEDVEGDEARRQGEEALRLGLHVHQPVLVELGEEPHALRRRRVRVDGLS